MTEQIKPPYLRRDETRGDLQVRIVDGYLRGQIPVVYSTVILASSMMTAYR